MEPPSKRPRGRPPLDPDSPSVNVCVRMTAKTFDELCRDARDARESLPETIRRAVRQRDFRNKK